MEAVGHNEDAPPEVMEAREVYNRYFAEFKKETDTEHERVMALGGLHIVGTERHESRRIDNQLRGRAGRQGDPGSTQFFISMEDDVMRLFGSERIAPMIERLGMLRNALRLMLIKRSLLSRNLSISESSLAKLFTTRMPSRLSCTRELISPSWLRRS